MIKRKLQSCTALAGAAMYVVLMGCTPNQPPVVKEVSEQTIHLPEIQKSIVAATGYESAKVQLSTTGYQLVVTLVDTASPKDKSVTRDQEAVRIAATIAGVIAQKPEFAPVQAIHVDYVQRQNGQAHIDDAIDFRKDDKGNFQHHIS